MKTPKRVYVSQGGDTEDVITARKAKKCARWKRKNKIAQLKRTIARMTAESRKFRELWIGGHLKFDSPEWEAFMILRKLKTPAGDATLEEKLDHWITLRKAAALALDAACFAAKAYGEAKAKERAACHPETAENGQQTELPPTGGQQACVAQNTENAKQENSPCTDADQQPGRKEHK